MQSDIMTVLNDALKERQNVMIQGLPGTGKTSIVLQWLKDHQGEIHGVFIDGAVLNSRPLSERSRRLNGLTVKGQLFTQDELVSFRQPDTVIVFDNYQTCSRDVKSHINLLADKLAVDESEEAEIIQFDSIVFVCPIVTMTM